MVWFGLISLIKEKKQMKTIEISNNDLERIKLTRLENITDGNKILSTVIRVDGQLYNLDIILVKKLDNMGDCRRLWSDIVNENVRTLCQIMDSNGIELTQTMGYGYLKNIGTLKQMTNINCSIKISLIPHIESQVEYMPKKRRSKEQDDR